MASLDHAMWFHRPFRADEWLLYAQDTPVGLGRPGLRPGLIFTQDGDLAVSVVQEGLIRLDAVRRPGPSRDARRRRPGRWRRVAWRPRRARRRRRRADCPATTRAPTGRAGRPARRPGPDRPRLGGDVGSVDDRSTGRAAAGRPRRPSVAEEPTTVVGRPGVADRGYGRSGRTRSTGRSSRSSRPRARPHATRPTTQRAGPAGPRVLARRRATSTSTTPTRRRHPRGRVPRSATTARRDDASARTRAAFGPAVPQPQRRRPGRSGPTAYLYIGLGDGGSGGDPQERAEPRRLLGKILRIDPSRRIGDERLRHPGRQPLRRRRRRHGPEIWLYGRAQPVALLLRPRPRPLDRRRRPGRDRGDRPPPRRPTGRTPARG